MTYSHLLKASEHPVKSVTIFKSSKAEVARTFAVELKSGQNKIQVRGLSSIIDADSARVTGLSDSVRLFDVVCTLEKSHEPVEDEIEGVIRRLKAKKQVLESEKRAREEANNLASYGKSIQDQHGTPKQESAFLESFILNGRKNLEAVMALDEELVVLDRQIQKEADKIDERKGKTNGIVFVTVSAKEGGPVEFKLTYNVSRASWETNYDLHASTTNGQPSPSVALQYKARVMQSTGEDWNDTLLTLSTASSDTNCKGLPALKPLYVKPAILLSGAKKTSGFGSNTNMNPFGGNSNVHQHQLFGGNASGQQQQQSGSGFQGLFTQAKPPSDGQAQGAKPEGLRVFGQPASSNAPMPASGVGLFGTSPAPASGTGIFGGGGLFGQQQQQSSSSFFGQARPPSDSQAQGAQPGGSYVFGQPASSNAPVPASGVGLFGASPAPAVSFGGSGSQATSEQGCGSFAGGKRPVGDTTATALVASIFRGKAPFETASGGGGPAPAPASGFGGFGGTYQPFAGTTTAPKPEEDEEEFEEANAPGGGAEAKTVVRKSSLPMAYTVEGKSNVPSDGVPHQVFVTSLPFEAAVTYASIPRAETVAYLQCKVKIASDYRLLPGPVSVFLDDRFVSKTNILDIDIGDTFECTLGVDPSIQLTYVRAQRTSYAPGGPFPEQYKTITYTTTTTAKNMHPFALPALLVRDSVPLGRDLMAVKVVLRRPAGLAEAEDKGVSVDGTEVRWVKDG